MTKLVFVGADLNARARLEAAFSGTVTAVPRSRLEEAFGDPDATNDQPEVAVVDLDGEGAEAVAELRNLGFAGRILGFFSHVNAELGGAAEAAGAEVYARGRFWRDLSDLLTDSR